MAAQDQTEGSQANSVLPIGNQIPLDMDPQSTKNVPLKDQFTSGDDYALKVRKPYTITKPRERWTDEEHKKFLEALKLYGRVWRRIEEHVGTKTAVQIRSHAQKYFSKVVRESNGSDASSVKLIEIPPPRPKRKPLHPYPRKPVTPIKTRTHLPKQQTRSTSPNLSVSEQENQSPTSVLSPIGSDMLNTPNGSISPVSSSAAVKPSGLSPSEPNTSLEDNDSSSPVHGNSSSTVEKKVHMKLEFIPRNISFTKESSGEAPSTQSLKLFGKTVLVAQSHRPSSPTVGNYIALPQDKSDECPEQTMPSNLMPMKFSSVNSERARRASPCREEPALHYKQFPNENSEPVEAGFTDPMRWWPLYGGVSFSFLQLHNPIQEREYTSSDCKEARDKEIEKEGSWTDSNSGTVNAGDDKSWEVETQSRQYSLEKEENEQKLTFLFKPSEEAVFLEQRANPLKCITRGFVPYKRCLAERDTNSSTITGEEREEQRTRLYL